jgi:hypothetical protein
MLNLGLALMLCACAATATPGPAVLPAQQPAVPSAPIADVVANAGTVVLTGERAFALAELAYTTAANGVGRLVDAGVIRGATATNVRRWNARARELLVTGKATANTVRKAEAATELFGLADNLNMFLEGR